MRFVSEDGVSFCTEDECLTWEEEQQNKIAEKNANTIKKVDSIVITVTTMDESKKKIELKDILDACINPYITYGDYYSYNIDVSSYKKYNIISDEIR